MLARYVALRNAEQDAADCGWTTRARVERWPMRVRKEIAERVVVRVGSRIYACAKDTVQGVGAGA